VSLSLCALLLEVSRQPVHDGSEVVVAAEALLFAAQDAGRVDQRHVAQERAVRHLRRAHSDSWAQGHKTAVQSQLRPARPGKHFFFEAAFIGSRGVQRPASTSAPSNLVRKLFPNGWRPWKGRSAWRRQASASKRASKGANRRRGDLRGEGHACH